MSRWMQIATGFEKLLARLPGPIRKPVEREWRPIEELFLRRRPPRLLVIGEPGIAVEAWVRTVFAMAGDKIQAGNGPWRIYRHRGALEFAVVESDELASKAITHAQPDLFLYVSETHIAPMDRRQPSLSAVFGETSRGQLLAEIAQALPLDARLEFARVSGEKTVQLEIAAMLTRSTAAVCTAIGAQPIPLADFPILTSLQVLMVSGIIFTTGRTWSGRLARDFLAALGANIGMAFLFREGARAAAKFLPGWGNAISGGIAGAGTYAIGRAASTYFIEGLPMTEARRRFQFFKKKNRPPQLPG